MSRSRLEFKVGLFVFISLLLVAALLLEFSRGTTFLRKTYQLNLIADNAGGLRPSAAVLLSGVQVGTVYSIQLSPTGTNVAIALRIYSEFTIRNDARFIIEQSGFLGDQYIAVYPDKNRGSPLKPGDISPVQEPFNLQEAARAATGFIHHIDQAATNLNDAINDVRRDLLNQQTLTNFANTIDVLQGMSEKAATTMDNLNSMILTNGVPVASAVSNLLVFSERLNDFVQSAQLLLDTNRPQLTLTVNHLEQSTAMLTNLLSQTKNGQGLAGAFLNNQQLAVDLEATISNLAVASGNLRSNGLWHFLWKPEQPKPQPASKKTTH